MKSLINQAGNALRLTGDIANITLLAVFAWATISLKDQAVHHYQSAGPLPSFSRAGFESLWNDPQQAIGLWHLVATWIFAVAAVGCGWMTVLGGRWGFHFALRLLNR